jgi:superoxide reductase
MKAERETRSHKNLEKVVYKMSENLFYRCDKCGNIVALIKSGEGTLTCCGQEMTRLQANSTDAAREKHVPVLEVASGRLMVTVGSVAHPMTAEHLIEWIAMVADEKIEIVHLKPGMEPKAEFAYFAGNDETSFTGENDEIVPNCEAHSCNFVFSDKTTKNVVAYAYCNLHGLWKTAL